MFDDFFIRALVAGIGIAFVTGPLGCFVVWRRLSYFGDTLAHSALLGVTMAYTFDLNIAISIKMVGLLLITGMLIIPAAMARNISDSPQKMVLFSIIGGLLSVVLGLYSSLEFNTSSGPSIIAAALILFILSLFKIKQSIKLKN